jgi:hypothetical protein
MASWVRALRTTARGGLAALVWLALSVSPSLAKPVLHEFLAPSPAEDLALEARVAGGNLAAAVANNGQLITAPDPERSPQDSQRVYGEQQTGAEASSRFQIDRDTRTPERLSYHEPFVPSVAPFKRTWAYDAVDERFELVVANKRLDSLSTGTVVRDGDDQFFGSLAVALLADVPVRIPTVGPETRLVASAVSPPQRLEFLHDGADNWFVRSAQSGDVRLTLQLAIERRSFDTRLADPSWEKLQAWLPPIPPSVFDATAVVLQRLGVSRHQRPREAITQLVGWFRGFAPTSAFPEATFGRELYLDLALSRKGVCRHRAYAFVVTALGLGIPARLLLNEAHAWVEVHDGERWHRIDLGGAAGDLDYLSETPPVPHQTPKDELPWPSNSSPGEELGRRAMGRSSGAPPPAPQAQPEPPPAAAAAEPSPEAAQLELLACDDSVQRGKSFRLSGSLGRHRSCGELRIDVLLVNERAEERFLQAVPSGVLGTFTAAISVPLDLRAGNYRVLLRTPGNALCGPATVVGP